MTALNTQIGGSHYKDMAIQPVEYITANNIGFIEGCVIKYVSRWRTKGGIKDLEKARHFLDLLIELESLNPANPAEQDRPERPDRSAESSDVRFGTLGVFALTQDEVDTLVARMMGSLGGPTSAEEQAHNDRMRFLFGAAR